MVELPEDIRIEETADAVHYVLPRRNPPHKWSGWLMAAMGVGMISAGTILAIVNPASSTSAMLILFAVDAVLVLLGLMLCYLGVNMLMGYCELVLHSEHIFAVEHTGFLRRTRKRTTHGVKRFVVAHEWKESAQAGMHTDILRQMAYRLDVEYDNGKTRRLTNWYWRQWLEAVATDMSRRLGLLETVHVNAPEADDEAAEANATQQPAGSTITLQHTDDGISIVVPPLKLLNSPDGRSVANLLGGGLLGAGAGFFVLFVVPSGGLTSMWFWLIFAIPALIGGFYVAAGVLSQRDTYLDIVDDTLLITTRRWRGVQQHTLERDEIRTIVQGESMVEINDEMLPQLHIERTNGDPIRLFTGRRADELQWLAKTLRDELQLRDAS